MNENHKRQKEEAQRMAQNHADNSNVVGTKEDYKRDLYYHQDREEYMSNSPEERGKMAVPKSMLEEEYDKSPGGGYTHNGNKHAARHKAYNKD